METHITREAAWELLRKYNKDSFHLEFYEDGDYIVSTWHPDEGGKGQGNGIPAL